MRTRRRTPLFGLAALCALPVAHHLSRQTLLEPYVEVELARVEEVHHLLDNFAEQVWPGWSDYRDAVLQLQFPNMLSLLISPRDNAPPLYLRVPGREVAMKRVYVDSHSVRGGDVKPPLLVGGAGGHMVMLRLWEHELTKNDVRSPLEDTLRFQSESQILVYAHELFHVFQFGQRSNTQRSISNRATPERNDSTQRQRLEAMLEHFVPPPIHLIDRDYAVFKEVEASALLEAYREKDDARALERLKEFLIARSLRHKTMPEQAIARERETSLFESTALYAQLSLVRMVTEGYAPVISQGKDPYFFNYRYVDEYIQHWMIDKLESFSGDTFDKDNVRYHMGVIQCHLLDRFRVDWKHGLFKNGGNLDDLLSNVVVMLPGDSARIRERLRHAYDIDALEAKHGPAIQARDGALDLVEGRTGTTFILDFTLTGSPPKDIVPYGEVISEEYISVFPDGIELIEHGDIRFSGQQSPMCQPWAYWVEWIDTEPSPDARAYSIQFESRDGDVLKNVTLTTRGFTLIAPDVRLIEKQDEVRIILRTKYGTREAQRR